MALSAKALAHLNNRDRSTGRFQAAKHQEAAVMLGSQTPAMDEAKLLGLMTRWPDIQAESIDEAAALLRKRKDLAGELSTMEATGLPARFITDLRRSITTAKENPKLATLEAAGIHTDGATIKGDTVYLRTDGGLISADLSDGIDFHDHGDWVSPDSQTPLEQYRSITSSLADFRAIDSTLVNISQSTDITGKLDEESGEAAIEWRSGEHSATILASKYGVSYRFPSDADRHAFLDDFQKDGEDLVATLNRVGGVATETRERMIWSPYVEDQRHHLRTGLRSKLEAVAAAEKLREEITASTKVRTSLHTSGAEAVLTNQGSKELSSVAVDSYGNIRTIVDSKLSNEFGGRKRNQQKLLDLVNAHMEQFQDLAEAARVGVLSHCHGSWMRS